MSAFAADCDEACQSQGRGAAPRDPDEYRRSEYVHCTGTTATVTTGDSWHLQTTTGTGQLRMSGSSLDSAKCLCMATITRTLWCRWRWVGLSKRAVMVLRAPAWLGAAGFGLGWPWRLAGLGGRRGALALLGHYFDDIGADTTLSAAELGAAGLRGLEGR